MQVKLKSPFTSGDRQPGPGTPGQDGEGQELAPVVEIGSAGTASGPSAAGDSDPADGSTAAAGKAAAYQDLAGHWARQAVETAKASDSVLRDQTPSIADRLGEIADAPWVPDIDAPLARVLLWWGRLHRLIVLPLCVLTDAIEWVLWRPARAYIAAAIAAVIWFTT